MVSPVPAMDGPSVAFAWFLDSMRVETGEPQDLMLVCQLCGEDVCEVEDGDTLRVLLNTALQHTCPK
jgi:hypothetical protein